MSLPLKGNNMILALLLFSGSLVDGAAVDFLPHQHDYRPGVAIPAWDSFDLPASLTSWMGDDTKTKQYVNWGKNVSANAAERKLWKGGDIPAGYTEVNEFYKPQNSYSNSNGVLSASFATTQGGNGQVFKYSVNANSFRNPTMVSNREGEYDGKIQFEVKKFFEHAKKWINESGGEEHTGKTYYHTYHFTYSFDFDEAITTHMKGWIKWLYYVLKTLETGNSSGGHTATGATVTHTAKFATVFDSSVEALESETWNMIGDLNPVDGGADVFYIGSVTLTENFDMLDDVRIGPFFTTDTAFFPSVPPSLKNSS